MNLAKKIPVGNPKLDMGGVGSAGDKKDNAVMDTDSQLAQQQQAFLTLQRERFCQLVADKNAGAKNDSTISEVFHLLSCRIHIGEWNDVRRVSGAINALGLPYQGALVILGGWHHNGELDNLKKPDEGLSKLIRKFRNRQRVEYWRRIVENEPKETWGSSKNMDALIESLAWCRPALDLRLWREPKKLGDKIQEAKNQLQPQIESALLFLQPRIFVFGPEDGQPLAGWSDFYDFVLAYHELVETFHSEFGQYYWGIYPVN